MAMQSPVAWTRTESLYVTKLMSAYKAGMLGDLPQGTTLGVFLSKHLQCDPTKIVRHIAQEGDMCNESLIYKQAVGNDVTNEQFKIVQTELAQVRTQLEMSLDMQQHSDGKNKKYTIQLASCNGLEDIWCNTSEEEVSPSGPPPFPSQYSSTFYSAVLEALKGQEFVYNDNQFTMPENLINATALDIATLDEDQYVGGVRPHPVSGLTNQTPVWQRPLKPRDDVLSALSNSSHIMHHLRRKYDRTLQWQETYRQKSTAASDCHRPFHEALKRGRPKRNIRSETERYHSMYLHETKPDMAGPPPTVAKGLAAAVPIGPFPTDVMPMMYSSDPREHTRFPSPLFATHTNCGPTIPLNGDLLSGQIYGSNSEDQDAVLSKYSSEDIKLSSSSDNPISMPPPPAGDVLPSIANRFFNDESDICRGERSYSPGNGGSAIITKRDALEAQLQEFNSAGLVTKLACNAVGTLGTLCAIADSTSGYPAGTVAIELAASDQQPLTVRQEKSPSVKRRRTNQMGVESDTTTCSGSSNSAQIMMKTCGENGDGTNQWLLSLPSLNNPLEEGYEYHTHKHIDPIPSSRYLSHPKEAQNDHVWQAKRKHRGRGGNDTKNEETEREDELSLDDADAAAVVLSLRLAR